MSQPKATVFSLGFALLSKRNETTPYFYLEDIAVYLSTKYLRRTNQRLELINEIKMHVILQITTIKVYRG